MSIKLSEDQIAKLRPVLDSEVWIACSNCGKVFYRSIAGLFMQKYVISLIPFVLKKPSQGYLDSARHWVESDHLICFKAHENIVPLSTFWSNQQVRLGLSKQAFLNAILKMESEQ